VTTQAYQSLEIYHFHPYQAPPGHFELHFSQLHKCGGE